MRYVLAFMLTMTLFRTGMRGAGRRTFGGPGEERGAPLLDRASP